MFDDIRCNDITESFQFKHLKYPLLELIGTNESETKLFLRTIFY